MTLHTRNSFSLKGRRHAYPAVPPKNSSLAAHVEWTHSALNPQTPALDHGVPAVWLSFRVDVAAERKGQNRLQNPPYKRSGVDRASGLHPDLGGQQLERGADRARAAGGRRRPTKRDAK